MYTSRPVGVLVSALVTVALITSISPVYAASPDGTLDTSFGTSGFTTTSASGNNDSVRSIVLDSQGRIIVGGYSGSKFVLARYTSGGVLDTSFGTSGINTTTPGASDVINSIALDSQGRIIAGGNSDNHFVLARYTSGGVLDTSFGTAGITKTALGTGEDFRSIALDSQGRIIAGGYSDNHFALARYTSGGVLDTSFGTSGFTTTTPGTGDIILSIALDGQGRIIAGGQSAIGGSNKFALARYTSGGVLDTSFGTSGFATTTPGTDDGIYSIALDGQGRIIAGGGAQVSSAYKFAIARYTTNGVLDTSFGTLGFNTVTKGSADGVSSITLDGQGRIIAGGGAQVSGKNTLALARYTSSGFLDTSFGTSGFTTISPGDGDGIIAITGDSQGRIIAAGHSLLGGVNKLVLARYLILGVPIFTLSSSSETAYTGISVRGYTVNSTGGAINSYSISPAVSNGLSFDASSGLLTGIPRATAASTLYTITGTNSSGSSTASYSLSVNDNPAIAQAAAAKAQQDRDTALALGTLAVGIGSVESGLTTLTLAATRKRAVSKSAVKNTKPLKKVVKKK